MVESDERKMYRKGGVLTATGENFPTVPLDTHYSHTNNTQTNLKEYPIHGGLSQF